MNRNELITIDPIFADDLENFGILTKIISRSSNLLRRPSVSNVFKAFKATFQLVATGVENASEISTYNSQIDENISVEKGSNYKIEIKRSTESDVLLLVDSSGNQKNNDTKVIKFTLQSNDFGGNQQNDDNSKTDSNKPLITTTFVPPSHVVVRKTIISTRSSALIELK